MRVEIRVSAYGRERVNRDIEDVPLAVESSGIGGPFSGTAPKCSTWLRSALSPRDPIAPALANAELLKTQVIDRVLGRASGVGGRTPKIPLLWWPDTTDARVGGTGRHHNDPM